MDTFYQKSIKCQYVVGIDLGTTNLKAGLFNTEGALIAQSEAEFSISRPTNGLAEQDTEEWWNALKKVLKNLVSEVPDVCVSAIGICSQVGSHIFVDENGQALTKVILWQDQRCSEFVNQLNEKAVNYKDCLSTGYFVDTTAIVARAEWARIKEPEIWNKTRYILSPKDYLNSRLTGNFATDALSQYGIVDDSGVYYKGILELVPNIANVLPPVLDFRSKLGKMRKMNDEKLDAAFGNAIVAVGTMDAYGNLYGSGATSHGDGIEVSGTCEIVGVLSEEVHPTAGVVTFPPVDNLYFHAGPTKSGGSAMQWFAGEMGITVAEMVKLAELAPAGSNGLIFLPYLEGERAPIWDDEVRGVFFGVSAEHKREHFCRAVIEGIAYSARHLLEEIEKSCGFNTNSLRISGGSSRDALCCQIRADISNRTIEKIHVRQSGVLGAALIATVASGLAGDIRTAAADLVHIEQAYIPDSEVRTLYDHLYSIYRKLYPMLKPAFSELAKFRNFKQS
ncbi:Carbohydrate kinase, FGGY-like protein [Ruminiclostridium papyrosolvens DSM 2782]|uniref:Carbohydrate kinase, FGGY-like protein n=1 Tax=Ruminiclostridium papyrosolvens DSM 2782 TaxID=588581 RepID=F1THI1_9FIRM|nr:FGGY family carbohydrate kinase [Ruminiclostridium papyrosolvens]EGD46184.1 Carbohydrate kinase, FGGY-like protein [Ruminiclostridium papyrosolvens DSM 2782]WES35964.1 FGGY family carbohydrate kinase [Ruminiclostridium papyrosolvens DSM 2782]